ncbi:MAG: NUDIX domain-containing protein [Pseudomonadota bacterium]
MSFEDSYLGHLRKKVGNDLVIIPGTRIIIENYSGEILLEKRTDFGLWGLPGGTAEPGENAQTSIIREVLEETGLNVSNVQAFGLSSDPVIETIRYPNGHLLQSYVVLFFSNTFSGDLRINSEENDRLEWFKPDALPDVLDNMRCTIEAYLTFKKTAEFQLT